MSEPNSDQVLPPRLFVMRIILFALVMGALVFLGVVVFLRNAPNAQPPQNATAPLLTYLGIGFGLVMFVMHLFFPRVVVANTRRAIARGTWNPSGPRNPLTPEQIRQLGDVGLLLALYQSQMIIGLALLEGATFFNLIAYLLEGDPSSLAVAGLLLVAMLWQFPTRTGLENFLVEQGELLRQARQSV